jgi:hypothetical protein
MRRSIPESKEKMRCSSCKKLVESYYFHFVTGTSGSWNSEEKKFIVSNTALSENNLELDGIYCPNCGTDLLEIENGDIPDWGWE